MSQRPLLSLAMMVKNEEDFLEDALKSAKGWVDEMVVVDTGSTDRTVQIAKDLGAKVSFFEWPNDFSKARNETIKRSSGEWIAILDADERFVGTNPAGVKAFLKPNQHYPYQAFLLKVINLNAGKETHSFLSQRIFPNHPDVGYTGRIHNAFGSISDLRRQFDLVQCNGLDIIHLGYDKKVFEEKKKLERNLSLLEAAVKDEPDVIRYRFYLGREYIIVKRYADAEKFLKSVIEDPKTEDLLKVESVQTLLAMWDNIQEDPFKRIELGLQFLDIMPKDIDLWYFVGKAYLDMGMTDEAIVHYEQSIKNMEIAQIQTSRAIVIRGVIEYTVAEYYWQKENLEKALHFYKLVFQHLSKNHEFMLKTLPNLALALDIYQEFQMLEEVLPLIVDIHVQPQSTWDNQVNLNLFFQILEDLAFHQKYDLIKKCIKRARVINHLIVNHPAYPKFDV